MTDTTMPHRTALMTGQWPDGAAFVDGGYGPIAEAKISVLDWGFTPLRCLLRRGACDGWRLFSLG